MRRRSRPISVSRSFVRLRSPTPLAWLGTQIYRTYRFVLHPGSLCLTPFVDTTRCGRQFHLPFRHAHALHHLFLHISARLVAPVASASVGRTHFFSVLPAQFMRRLLVRGTPFTFIYGISSIDTPVSHP